MSIPPLSTFLPYLLGFAYSFRERILIISIVTIPARTVIYNEAKSFVQIVSRGS